MLEPADRRPPIWFWVVSIVLLLWGLGGASIYVAYFVETPEEFAATAEIAENREAYAEYFANIPLWAVSVGIVAAATRLAGAIGLLLRRAWALPLYVVSLVFFLIALYRAFVLADVASAMSGAHIATEVVFVVLGVSRHLVRSRQSIKGDPEIGGPAGGDGPGRTVRIRPAGLAAITSRSWLPRRRGPGRPGRC